MFTNSPSIVPAREQGSAPPWHVLVVDDEPEVHTVTRIALRDLDFLGRGVAFIGAHSAEQARDRLAQCPDLAIAIVDVVMEADDSGLDLVNYIRNELGNRSVRIILRTGMTSVAPERQVVNDFEIDGYLNKSEVTTNRLYSVALTSLRAYHNLVTVRQTLEQADRQRRGLESVLDATLQLFALRHPQALAEVWVERAARLVSPAGDAGTSGAVLAVGADGSVRLLAATGRCAPGEDGTLDASIREVVDQCLATRRSGSHGRTQVACVPLVGGRATLLVLDGPECAGELDLPLWQLLSRSVSEALESAAVWNEQRETQLELLATIGDAVETRDTPVSNHTRRVAHLARLVARASGVDETRCELLFLAAHLHDIGKFAVPESVLLKRGPMSDEDWRIMRGHPAVGEELLSRSALPLFEAAAAIAGQHHERYDGSGYPLGLRGEEIDLNARLVAIADVFDALAHRRCYKEAWDIEHVVAHMRAERGRHFDPALLDCLLARLDEVDAMMQRFPDSSPDVPTRH